MRPKGCKFNSSLSYAVMVKRNGKKIFFEADDEEYLSEQELQHIFDKLGIHSYSILKK